MAHYVDANKVGYGLVIPGYGHANWGDTGPGDTWAKDRPVCLFAGNADGANSDYILFDILLSAAPLSAKVNVVTGVYDAGAVKISLPATGQKTPPTFVPDATVEIDPSSIFTQRIKEATGLLATANLSPKDSTIDLWSRDGAQFSANQTIYIEDETIVLLEQVAVSGEVQTFTCYRGAYGSRAAFHQSLPVAGSRPDPLTGWDNRVYSKWDPLGKPVYMIERIPEYVAETGSYEARWEVTWRGWLTRNATADDNGSVVSTAIMDVFSPFFGRQLNKEPHGAEWDGQFFRAGKVFSSAVAPNGSIVLTANEISSNYGPAARAASPRTVVQFKEAIVNAEFVETETINPDTGDTNTGFAYQMGTFLYGTGEVSTVLMNSPVPEVETKDVTKSEPIYEVIVGGTAMVDATGATQSSIQTGWYPHHPVTGALCFMLSTGRGFNFAAGLNFDIFSLKVGLGMPVELVDVTSFINEVVRTPDQKAYGYCFGYGGSAFNWGDIRNRLITPYRRFVHPNANYQMSLSQLEPITPTTVDFELNASELVRYSEEEDYGWDEQIQTLGAKANLPWEKEREIHVRDVAQGVQVYDPDPKDPQFKPDVSAMRPVDRRGNGEKRDAAEALLEWMRRPMPGRKFALPWLGWPRPHVGARVSIYIDVPVPWKDADGEPLAIGTTIYGLLDEVRHEFDTVWYECILRDINDALVSAPVRVARSFRIDEVIVDGALTQLRCNATQHGRNHLTYDPDIITDFGGRNLEVWDLSDGVVSLYTTGDNVTAAVGAVSTNTGGGGFFDLYIDTPDDTLPVAGQYVRLPRRSTAGSETDWEGTRSQAYMAGDAEIFSDGDRGKVYI